MRIPGQGWSRAACAKSRKTARKTPQGGASPSPTGHRAEAPWGEGRPAWTQSRSTQEGATARGPRGFCGVFFFKRHLQLQPRGAQRCGGLSPWPRGEETGNAAQQQVPSALREGMGTARSPPAEGTFGALRPGSCSAGGDGRGQTSGTASSQGKAAGETCDCLWKCQEPTALALGGMETPLQDGARWHLGVRCW